MTQPTQEMECTDDNCMRGRIGYAVCSDDCKCKCQHTKFSEIFNGDKK